MAKVNRGLAEPIKFHDLRRTAASHLGIISCPLEVVSEILNHASPAGITAIYARSDPLPRMREWLDRLAEHYESVI
jgi:integrase